MGESANIREVPAYLLTWNPAKWNDWESDGALDKFVMAASKGRSVAFQWSTARSRRAVKNDRVFLIKLGREGRGIFASGTVMKSAHFDPHDAAYGYVVVARWDRFLDPRRSDNLLDCSSMTNRVMRQQHWIPQSSGTSIRANVIAELEKMWGRHLATTRGRSPRGSAHEIAALLSELPEVERALARRTITKMLRAAALRPLVLKIWPHICAACGVQLRDGEGNSECEVAHVHDVHAGGPDLVANAIPLCRTHHWAFDRHLWGINPETLRIEVNPNVGKNLDGIRGRRITRPKTRDMETLAVKHLAWRWQVFATR